MEGQCPANNLAPIAVFVYNRYDHTKKTLSALKNNELSKESELHIFCDAPKKESDYWKVEKVRTYAHSLTGFKRITVYEREQNLGCANSIINGIDQIFEKHDKCIIVEDDVVTAPGFLYFMNEALKRYEDTNKVFSVSGYSYLQKKYMEGIPDVYCSKLPCCWGWGTWRNKWKMFDKNPDGMECLKRDPQQRKAFNYGGYYDYYRMLSEWEEGKNDSWAIRWYYTIFKNDGLAISPKYSLVNNMGFDGSGTHCGENGETFIKNITQSRMVSFPEKLELQEMTIVRKSIQHSLEPNMIKRCIRMVKSFIESV